MKHLSQKSLLIVTMGIAVFAIGGSAIVWIDALPMRSATPPKSLQTIEDFKQWRGEETLGEGFFEDPSTGMSYRVMLAPAGRHLASGPSAYLFDSQERFIEWTPDMGDVRTTRNGFDLSSGNLTHNLEP